MKKQRIAFTVADDNNIKYARMMERSLRKFHSEEELPLKIITGEELKTYLKDDPHFFYRNKPIIARDLIYEYDTVISLDADQIILGDISYLWKTNDFDVGTVLNINRVDPQKYGYITVANIPPQKYFNAGLVVMKSEDFVEDFFEKCHGQFFLQMQFREQDILNILCHFGRYNVRCLDYYDPPRGAYNWWGLVSKGEWDKTRLVRHMDKNPEEVVVELPKGKDGYPDRDITLKIIHWAGGNNGVKMNYKAYFPPEVSDYIDTLVK